MHESVNFYGQRVKQDDELWMRLFYEDWHNRLTLEINVKGTNQWAYYYRGEAWEVFNAA